MTIKTRLTGSHTLNDLPIEILTAVCSHLTPKSRYQVIQVSHRFKAVAEPFLYSDIKLLVWNKPDGARKKLLFDKLVDDLTERPELGAYVRALTLQGHDGDFDRHDELLQRLPNIRYLELSPPDYDLMVRNMRDLECLKLNYDMLWYHYRRQSQPREQPTSKVEIMARHFWMPKLRRLEVEMPDFTIDDGSNPFINLSSDLNRASPITTLCLTHCGDIDLGVLPDMLQAVKVLERFTFTISCQWEGEHMRTPGISPQAIGQSLEVHMETLVELIIAGNDAAWFLNTSLFGTLARCRHLKRLAIPEPFLVPNYVFTLHQCLPSQLADLQLQYPMGFTQGLDNQRKIRQARIHNLGLDKHRSLPKLKRIIWWYQQSECWSESPGRPTRYGDSEVLTNMVALFKDVGVHFEWLSASYFDETPFGAREVEGSW